MKLLIATRNSNKFKEFNSLLSGLPFNLISVDQIAKIPKNFHVQESGKTFKANARLKAKGYGKFSNFLTLADDSGFMIDHLDGQPGIHSGRFAHGDFHKARKRILQLLKAVPKSKRTAQFVCVLALYNPKLKKLNTFTGIAPGYISLIEKGDSGFGYDSIFIPENQDKTYAQISEAKKNQISHRALAFKKLAKYLKMRL